MCSMTALATIISNFWAPACNSCQQFTVIAPNARARSTPVNKGDFHALRAPAGELARYRPGQGGVHAAAEIQNPHDAFLRRLEHTVQMSAEPLASVEGGGLLGLT
jgi:hypothetical protein